jgi:hypothetical protein
MFPLISCLTGVSSLSKLFLPSSQRESVGKGSFTVTSDTTFYLRRTVLAEQTAEDLFTNNISEFSVVFYVSLICFIVCF